MLSKELHPRLVDLFMLVKTSMAVLVLEQTAVNLLVLVKTSVAVLVLEKTAVKRLLLPKIVKSFVHPYRLGVIMMMALLR